MKSRHWSLLLFFVTSLLCGFGFWWRQDWRVYADLGERGMLPMFELHPAEQLVVSAAAGVFWGLLAAGVSFATGKVWAARRGGPHRDPAKPPAG